ncbi:hypothetical protein K2173_009308 [Erythroxylum novogranatense]|uniref:Uncharacterized protein n=1 Tax=Erythroxylum novogranatense TaxID=1862640 RepID=A0AAV8U3L2_9ROSI|nr:hypothetical protein K2173_009308 [Erythroxylum novogranatense]
MSQEGPKLYTNKPKKALLKQFQDQKLNPPSSQSAAAASYKMGSQSTSPPPSPPQAPKESFLKRNKFLVPLVLTVNLAVGAYLFMRTKKKDIGSIEGEPESKTTSLSSPATPNEPVSTTPTSLPATVEPVKPRDPIPENQQRELLKWILEEKRKLKPKDSDEKKRIDDEKDVLKRLIRAKSIPTI